MGEPVLYSERNRRRARDQQEAQGTVFWTADFSESTRRKIAFAGEDSIKSSSGLTWPTIQRTATDIILRNHGWKHLTVHDADGRQGYGGQLAEYMFKVSSADYPDIVEAVWIALAQNFHGAAEFTMKIKDILSEDRISFDFIDGRMIPLESQHMHAAVVVPVITLLSERDSFGEAESSYLKALEEISRGDAGDAITDAGRALQETLEALDCEGRVLGDLLKSAKKKDLLGPHDSPMTDAILKLYQWAAADRNAWGDAHTTRALAIEDAWLTVHVVGALILRLASGPQRGAS